MKGGTMRRSRKVGLLVAMAAVLVFPVALAHGAAAPTVSTESARDVTSTTATFAGRVNPNGDATNYAFDWGTTTAYGQQTASTSAGAGSATKTVTAAVSGLTPGTTYHYRITATNSTG